MRKNISAMHTAARAGVVLAAATMAVVGLAGSASAEAAPEGSVVGFSTSGKAIPVRVVGTAGLLSGRFYGWEDNNFSGDRWVDVAEGACSANKCEIDWWDGDNEISSVSNESSCKVRLWANDGWTGRFYDVPAHSSNGNLSQVGFDNEAESLEFIC
ncbi:hypothetical protein V5P93_002111 [Actinokineospora auranticolor]|uniref:Peptidase inhibitor family I36 n=1 Tax=Actinokineospora auranticolor TaxID=155976 RepID=A0A2S6GDT9_9PSEU|nr:hypothetical protein [Actinokineospora auranticolor]PPK63246.1 hypothetical protein CLV40_13038 [Actinokineospora auranticolor]